MAPDAPTIQDDVFADMVSAGLSARMPYIRTVHKDPLTRGLIAAGATVVGNTEFRMVGETGAIETPPASLNFEVRGLPARRITTARKNTWRVAVRLGPNARGDASNYIQSVTETPHMRSVARPLPRR